MLTNILYHFFFLTLFFQGIEPQDLKRFEYESPHMGTLFRIILYAPDEATAKSASHAAFQKVEVLNEIMSDYISDSELNELSATSGTGKAVRVSPSLFFVLKKAEEFSRITDGAFDITMGPYIQLWREMHKDENPQLPDDSTMAEFGSKVGYTNIKFNEKDHSVQLTQEDMLLDLGGIAKGYAADEALSIIQEFGISSVLVDAGGDIMLGDPPPDQDGWKIVIPTHNKENRSGYIELTLSNKAITTSGDLFQYVEIDGRRYSHIINPRTGLGVTEAITTTIIAPDGITADAYASALNVMGPSSGMKFAEQESDIAVYIEYLHDDKIEIKTTPSFEALLDF
ncbi:MAG: FAD:protein FMN transferase [Balneolales bacterium]